MKSADSTVDNVAVSSPTNERVASLPNHLKQHIVDQNFEQYTPIDHAVWRYIMRQSTYYLIEHAHQIYFKGLTATGISLERIPRIEEMNEILSRIGWGAVAVDGFIPPAAFMEFQAYRVLVIACDMRQIDHIEYTPAPDIVHEAAGHAPIIVDQEYADYLQRFGEIGAKAMSSKADFALYEAIRHLSILKERPDTKPDEIIEAEKRVTYCQDNLGQPSEMALLSRLHWWTVEYGLIGSVKNCKIYGAGLLSSIGESVSCLGPEVKKIPYSFDTANYAFDITTKQPQLFVTSDFNELSEVLEKFAATMAFSIGGITGLKKAIEGENISTAQYSSGLEVTGKFVDVISEGENIVYLRTGGSSALAVNCRQLSGHGKDYHRDGFGSPVGKFKNCPRSPELLDDSALENLGAVIGRESSLEFESGLKVEGELKEIIRENGKILLLKFTDCTVTYRGSVLFQPEWGTYDMAVGESIVSVYSGAADKDSYDQIALVAKERTNKYVYDETTRQLWPLYEQVARIRQKKSGQESLPTIWEEIRENFPNDWLLTMEIVEILKRHNIYPDLLVEMSASLHDKKKKHNDLSVLIDWGFKLVDYHS